MSPRYDSPEGQAVLGTSSSTVDEGRLDDEEASDSHRSRDFVQSLERGLAIIRVFNSERPSLTVSEIAREVGMTRAAVRRFLLTLGELGYLYSKNNRFELTPRVLELGYAYLSALSFPDIALPRLEQLVAETGEASEGSVLDGGDIVYVVRVPGPALMTISVNIGARRPAHATAMGRALLANLPPADLDAFLDTHDLVPVQPRTITDVDALRAELNRIREDGYALVNQELEEGLVAIAVPVRDRTGRVRAAINLSTHIGRKSVKEMRALIPAVRAAAADIEVGLKNSLSWPN
jgi:IclR family pca regulon transcriptional regulator